MVIGLSGVAGSGKDTFYELLNEQISCRRVSLAHALKKEVNEWTLKHYEINALTCSRNDKEKIREFLVFHGSRKRAATNGRYWIDRVMETLAEDMEDRTTVITDIRYDDYPSDEVDWLKNELDGILVHISQWHWDYPDAIKTYIAPANTEEERNDPKVKAKADYLFEAQKVSGTQEEVKDSLRPKVKEFIKWMSSA